MENKVLIAPSILSADFGKLNEEVDSIEADADVLHVDVMDGHFVPNLTFGAPVLKCIDTLLPKHVHLMVTNPGDLVEDFVKAGADTIIFHVEAVEDVKGLLDKIKGYGVKAGVSIKPGTGVEVLADVIGEVDDVLVMSVEPGFGGQEFMPIALDKIKRLREMHSDLVISVDGGINAETAQLVREAGANILVAGSYVFKAENRKAAIESLRS